MNKRNSNPKQNLNRNVNKRFSQSGNNTKYKPAFTQNRNFGHSFKKETDHVKESENALYLVYNPSNLYDWKENFESYAITKYGDDAGFALKTSSYPHYQAYDTFEEYIDNKDLVHDDDERAM